MLQRIQTVWALLAAVCAALTFKFAFYSGNMPVGTYGHVFREVKAVPVINIGKDSASAGSSLILIVTAFLIIGILINIFNFKARKKQFWISIVLFLASLLNIFLYYWKSGVPPFTEGSYSLGAIFALAIPVFLLLTTRGIRKDEKLVKSADRLR